MKLNYKQILNGSIVHILIWLFLISNGDATIDLSNLDLKNFQYFRYTQTLPNGELRNVMAPAPSIRNHIDKAKAVATYFRKVLLGNTAYDAESVPFVFSPSVEHLRENFQRKYGYRGKYLIESLGNGYFRYSSGYVPSINYRQKTP